MDLPDQGAFRFWGKIVLILPLDEGPAWLCRRESSISRAMLVLISYCLSNTI